MDICRDVPLSTYNYNSPHISHGKYIKMLINESLGAMLNRFTQLFDEC